MMTFRLLLALARLVLAVLVITSAIRFDLESAISWAVYLLFLSGIALIRLCLFAKQELYLENDLFRK